MNLRLRVIAAAVTVPCSLLAMEQLHVPVDAEALKQAEIAVREVQQDHDSAASIRAYRRWLEFYPNEPSIQAGIYRAMSMTFAQDGNEEQAMIWRRAADNLDPTSGRNLPVGSATTRGATDKMAAILAAVNQTAQTVQVMRQSFRAANPNAAMPVPAQPFPQQPVGSPGYQPVPATQPMPGYAPPQPQFAPGTGTGQPQPIALDAQGNPIQQPMPQQPIAQQPIAQQPIAQQPGPQQFTPPQPMQPVPVDAQGNPMPQAMSPAQPQIQQMPPAPQPQAYQQPQQQSPPQQQYAPQQQPYPPQQQQYPAQQQQYPQTTPYPQQSQRYTQPAQYQQQPYGTMAPQRPQYRQPPPYAQPRAPYGAPAGYYRPQQARRGSAGQPIKVFHDHSRLGDSNYFDPPCGALLLVENGSLTFTPAGGEQPLLIPTTDIIEIRMNTIVAKEVGAFHIITKSGLYLALAPAEATAEEGRADMDELRKQLGLDQ